MTLGEARYLVIDRSGREHELDLTDPEKCPPVAEDPMLKQFILSEEVGYMPHEPPAHIELMRRLELVDYEPASDVGHMRFYPKGALMKDLIADWVLGVALSLGAMVIETPTMYRADEPDIRAQAERFVEKDYKLQVGNKVLFLRFAGDFGLFRMMKDVKMSVRQLPVRVFEIAPSYRLETRRECVGLRRMRKFTMPDLHCFCKDVEQALEEFRLLTLKYAELLKGLGLDFVHAYRAEEAFYEENRDFFVKLAVELGKPTLVQLMPERKHYWALKNEFQYVDSVGKSFQLSTVQIDVEDSERYGITYVDTDGSEKGCTIVHSSPGSIERLMCAVLEEAAKMMKAGGLAMLPTWLSPTQVRVIPIADRHLDYALKVAEELVRAGIRADVDDRRRSMDWKVRMAGMEWVPYVAVVGDKEVAQGTVMVTIRAKSGPDRPYKLSMTIDELRQAVLKELEGKPRRPHYLPIRLSMRPAFR
ncbi:threonine--tRNA ligase [Candidatus Bathyarchaeota archaeon ex4484_135]|nr:MAG: threonine--tRNA ligase [Candidatus Bathyarchaeota archaeon ex4484_135]